jgi:hypothetical protein
MATPTQLELRQIGSILSDADIRMPTATVTASRNNNCRVNRREISVTLGRIGRGFVHPVPINTPLTMADVQPSRRMPEDEQKAKQKG